MLVCSAHMRDDSYEMQVSDGSRGCGLCRFFVESLKLIGKHWKMEKILLTVLKGTSASKVSSMSRYDDIWLENTAARQVYRKLG